MTARLFSAAPALPRSAAPGFGLSTPTIATMLCAASIGELLLLRVGTRTAVHIPDLEAVYTPFRLVAATGRFVFSMAVVLLVVLLGRLILELHRADATAVAAGLGVFVAMASLARLGLVTANIVGAATVTAVIVAATVGALRLPRASAAILGLFAIAYSIAALSTLLPDASVETVGRLTLRSEQLVVFAAIASGPAVRHALGGSLVPSRRANLGAGALGITVAAAIVANPSTTHVLMLWNFGLTGSLPAVFYGLAAASLAIAAASVYRHHGPSRAAGLALVALGGLGLISTYQSGLTLAGLALFIVSAGPISPTSESDDERSTTKAAKAPCRRSIDLVVP